MVGARPAQQQMRSRPLGASSPAGDTGVEQITTGFTTSLQVREALHMQSTLCRGPGRTRYRHALSA